MELEFTEEPRGSAYRDLVMFARGHASHFGFVVFYPTTSESSTVTKLLQDLSPHLVTADTVTSWPGSTLADGYTASRYLYDASLGATAVLVSAADGLFQWTNPALPNDLHFVRPDSTVVLGSNAVEGEAWLSLSDSEVQEFDREAPVVARMTTRASRSEE